MANFVKKLGEKLNFFSKTQVNPTDLSEDNAKKEVTLPDNQAQPKVKSTKKVSKRPRKKVHKVCKYCLKPFTATRVDAMYCRNSCRQAAYEKVDKIAHFYNAAEHFFLDVFRIVVSEILYYENKPVHINTIHRWKAYISIGYDLYHKYIDENSMYTQMYLDEVYPTFNSIEASFRNNNGNSTTYTLKQESRDRWNWALGG